MGQRVTLEQAARLTGRAEKTLRAWLLEDPPVLSVVYGHWRGGVKKSGKTVKGRTRLLDVDELQSLNADRGGTWHAEHLPPLDVETLAAEVAALRRRILALESSRNAPPAFTTASVRRLDDERGMNTRSSSDFDPTGLLVQQSVSSLPQRTVGGGVWPHIGLHKNKTRKAKAELPEGWVELPAGWIAATTFCQRHGLDIRSLERQRPDRVSPPELAPEGHPWGSYHEQPNKYYAVTAAYRADQLPEVIHFCQEKWPASYHPCYDTRCPCDKTGLESTD